MSSYSYFPGCALHKSSQEYDKSTRLVCKTLEIELKELPEWSCCGAAPSHHTQAKLAMALAGRNLALAEKEEVPLLAPCPACFSRLKLTAHELKNDPQLAETIKKETKISFSHQIEILHLLEVFREIAPDKIKQLIKVDFSALKVVPYYGCLLVRPKEIAMDDIENPVSMDNLLETLGTQVMPWDAKVTCCGSVIGIGNKNIVAKLTGDILQRANLAGAQAVVVACPLCHSNLDLRQQQIHSRRHDFDTIPIIYITQLMGLAFGFSPKEVGLDKNIIDPMPLLKSLGIKLPPQ